MTIREHKTEDKSQVLNLFNEFGDFFVGIDKLKFIIRAANYAETFLSEMLENTSVDGVVYVAEDNNRVVGFIGGNIKDLTSENTVENVPMKKGRILELFVTKDYRSKGVGRILMEKLEEYFKKNGCHTVNVEVFAQNINAYNFYSSFGYENRNLDMMKVLKNPK